VLKSGCRAEQAKLRTAERLTNLLAVLCVVGWRVFWLTITSRVAPTAPPGVAFTPAEVTVLDRVAGGTPPASKRTVSYYLWMVAKLGGYMARTKDPPPGNLVVWRGLARLADLCLGLELNEPDVGNWKPMSGELPRSNRYWYSLAPLLCSFEHKNVKLYQYPGTT
jgi:hypothetical protein